MRIEIISWRGRAVALALLASLPGCGAVQQVDTAMRRIDVLDRVFLPRPTPPPLPVEVAVAMPPPLAKDPLPEVEPQAEPEPVPVRVAEPAAEPAAQLAQRTPPDPALRAPPDPALRTAFLLRQNPWIAQFWGELNTAQQGRVTRALARRGEGGQPAGTWDPMGLGERVRLLFGDGT